MITAFVFLSKRKIVLELNTLYCLVGNFDDVAVPQPLKLLSKHLHPAKVHLFVNMLTAVLMDSI